MSEEYVARFKEDLTEDDVALCKDYLFDLRKDCMKTRRYDEDSRDRSEGEFQRDYTRIMYSSSFRRLQGKMQLLGLSDSGFYRNRLTHSLEVAQIARSIAADFGYTGKESFVVEAGALAHDIGNPPFGHAGERFLNDVYKDIGGFEGNAQTLRILTNIERKKPKYPGLNLTYRTQLAVVKYFAQFEDEKFNHNSKFIYNDDYIALSEFIEKNEIKHRTLDVQIVDIADEIAYAAHDLEDGLRVKAFTIDDIMQEFWNSYFWENDSHRKAIKAKAYAEFKEIVNKAKETAGYEFKGDRKITSSDYLHLFGMELASRIIYKAIKDIRMVDVDKKKREKTKTKMEKELGFGTPETAEIIGGLKKIVFECINHNNEVYHYEQEGKKVIEFLANFYKGKNTKYLPPEYRAENWEEYGMPKIQERLTCDYIAGMMDNYAIEQYEKYSGEKFRGKK